MTSICLILSGAALLINGLGLLGRVPARDGAYFNVLIGGLQLVLALLVAVTADGDQAVLFGVSGVFLFGLTYLYVGLDGLLGLGSVGLGWFCGLVAVLGLVFAASNAVADPFLAALWVSWAALWALFFLLLAAGRSGITRFTGWSLVLLSQVTTTAPALLALTGAWPTDAGAAVATLALVGALFGLAGWLAVGRRAEGVGSPTPESDVTDASIEGAAARTAPARR